MPNDRINNEEIEISLIIPIKDECSSLEALIASVKRQTYKPAEIILIDGGSSDTTIELANKLISDDERFKLIKTPKASPGKGRNIGVENAAHQWIAFTDAGIKLEDDWLEKLAQKLKDNPQLDVIYGNFRPSTNNLFEKCATFTYVAAQRESEIRSRFIASSLLRKDVWEKIGGFPDLRAAEDLIFMEAIEKENFKVAYVPEAMVNWDLRPDTLSTFKKFVLYSEHNVRANRQWDWHYGMAKQYLFIVPFIILSFVFSWWWLIAIVLLLMTRTARRIFLHRFEYGFKPLFNPIIFFEVAILILVIDIATFVGWAKSFTRKEIDI